MRMKKLFCAGSPDPTKQAYGHIDLTFTKEFCIQRSGESDYGSSTQEWFTCAASVEGIIGSFGGCGNTPNEKDGICPTAANHLTHEWYLRFPVVLVLENHVRQVHYPLSSRAVAYIMD